jgi:hypothetical protein
LGRKNIDRVHISHFRHRVATVADMQARRWDVISRCRVCGLMMTVDLPLIAKHSGPKTILWNRLARCKRIGCQGHVEFQARFPGRGVYATLAADEGSRLSNTIGNFAGVHQLSP